MIGFHLIHAILGAQTRHTPGGGLPDGPWTGPSCEHAFVTEEERTAAEAEVARRSRVMAGLDDVDGAALEASIVEAIQTLRNDAGPAPEQPQAGTAET